MDNEKAYDAVKELVSGVENLEDLQNILLYLAENLGDRRQYLNSNNLMCTSRDVTFKTVIRQIATAVDMVYIYNLAQEDSLE